MASFEVTYTFTEDFESNESLEEVKQGCEIDAGEVAREQLWTIVSVKVTTRDDNG